jgi:hypothetical protein
MHRLFTHRKGTVKCFSVSVSAFNTDCDADVDTEVFALIEPSFGIRYYF